MTAIKYVNRFLHGFELRSTGKWFLLSTITGVLAGLGAIAFQFLGQLVMHFALGVAAGYWPGEPAGEHLFFEHGAGDLTIWTLVLVVSIGGLVSGWLVYTFAPEAEGHGTDAVIDSFHNKRGHIPARIAVIKTIASAVTLGTGGSGGREGPIAQIGAAIGSTIARRLKLTDHDRRILLAAGMGAGVGAIFRAPLAGALFAGEILYKDADLESDAIVPAAISSIVGYSVYGLTLPREKCFAPLFGASPTYSLGSPLELFPFALLAVILVLAGIVYIQAFHRTHRLFRKLPVKPHFRPAIGAALAGLFAAGLYHACDGDERVLSVMATGYSALQDALQPEPALGLRLLLVIALCKIVTTSLTISSGGSGGVFGPSMVIGGCLGAAVGQYFHSLWPGLVAQPQAYAVVGMAGFFAGCAHAPFSTIIMVSEMTGNYNLLLPAMWVSTLCFLLCRRWTLYSKQVPTRLQSAAHRGDFVVDVLEGIQVRDVVDTSRQVQCVPEAITLKEIVHMLAETSQHYFPVVDVNERMVGIFSATDVRSYLYDETIWHLADASDVMVTRIVSVQPGDDLNTAMQRFTALNLDELPILAPENNGRLLGMLRRKDAIAVYNQRLIEHKHSADNQA